MSNCISSHGEYSEHEPGDPCPWCGEYDTERIIAERDEALARIQAVRDVHQPLDALHTNTGRVRKVCTGCGTDDGNWQVWPCPTIRAIERKS